MFYLSTVTLLINGLTLALALGFLIIILWHDSKKPLNQFFAVFLLMVVLWNSGSLLVQVVPLISDMPSFAMFAASIMEMGFASSSVAIYILTTVLIGISTPQFRTLAFASLFVVIVYRLFLIFNPSVITMIEGLTVDEVLGYQFQALFLGFYVVFDGVTLFLVWRYRRKIRSRGVIAGIVLFLTGQGLVFVNPSLVIASFTTPVSSIGALIISFAIIQREIIMPLSDRDSQVEAMHRVSLAISSQIAIDTLLSEIATQASGWLDADGVGIFLKDGQNDTMKLVTVFNLPDQFLDIEVPVGRGVAGTVAANKHTIYLENYQRDWQGEDEFPLARRTFGSLICVPLIYARSIIGVLMVVSGQQGKLFAPQDSYLLELLGAQAAVAIAHSQLFAEQRQLTKEVEAAHSQLETVLTSTENPVIAVDRDLKLILANPAAKHIFSVPESLPITEVLPREVFPSDFRDVIHSIRDRNSYVYEVLIQDKIYLCHLATLGTGDNIEGWVAVLNDITQLKELDRMKSEMVRMASHDLKNPLMGAMAYLDLLRDDVKPLENSEIEESVNTIEWQLERMHRIIGGILDIERLNKALVQTERCDAGFIVTNALAELEHFIADRGVAVDVDIAEDLPAFKGDTEQFSRVIINLLENAVKFTLAADGRVSVRVYSEDECIVFAIKDNGVGIPDDLVPYVFDRFFRGQQKGIEHVTGSGLGLSLVKTIVESHKGHVWLESEESVGTTFFVAIPEFRDVSINNSYSQ